MQGEGVERANDETRGRKNRVAWRVCLCVSSFIICLPIYWAIGVYALRDDTCGGTDKVSLEKRCQKAIEHYKGRQVNF